MIRDYKQDLRTLCLSRSFLTFPLAVATLCEYKVQANLLTLILISVNGDIEVGLKPMTTSFTTTDVMPTPNYTMNFSQLHVMHKEVKGAWNMAS